MPGRTPRAAVEAFSTPLRESLACILPPTVQLRAHGARLGESCLLALLGQRDPVRLPGPLKIGLFITHEYEVIEVGSGDERYRVHSRGYHYELSAEDGRTLVCYDWHPDGQVGDPVRWPHVHLRSYTAPINLSHGHWPSGRVSLESVIRVAIRDLQVPPLREDWEALLDKHEQAFADNASWGGPRPRSAAAP
ncbi:MAG TPA: hypothetical protein VFB73_15565 [Chloroflexota bacterium]|nr:hypothetical protein [Chloroflexota bacterium]HZU07381.1 hypothetical protein [Chloroflexota bacterium]